MVMVKPRNPGISAEFAGGILPGLTKNQQAASKEVPSQVPGPGQVAAMVPSQGRKKISPYIDAGQADVIDNLFYALKPFGVQRDLSMLMRALINQAGDALNDQERLAALARYCLNTPPDR